MGNAIKDIIGDGGTTQNLKSTGNASPLQIDKAVKALAKRCFFEHPKGIAPLLEDIETVGLEQFHRQIIPQLQWGDFTLSPEGDTNGSFLENIGLLIELAGNRQPKDLLLSMCIDILRHFPTTGIIRALSGRTRGQFHRPGLLALLYLIELDGVEAFENRLLAGGLQFQVNEWFPYREFLQNIGQLIELAGPEETKDRLLSMLSKLLRQMWPDTCNWSNHAALSELASCAINSPHPQVQAALWERLREIEQTSAEEINQLCQFWYDHRNADLEKILIARGWAATAPAELRVITTLMTGQTDNLAGESLKDLNLLIEACEDPDPIIASAALKELRASNPAWVLEILADTNDRPPTTPLSQSMPDEPAQEALYYFITEQWERHRELDFDLRFLTQAYRNGSAATRRLLARKVRISGQVEYLKAITAVPPAGWNDQANLEEVELLVESLANSREWERLWCLVFELPLTGSLKAVRRLANSKWRPTGQDERKLFTKFKKLVGGEIIPDNPDHLKNDAQKLPLIVQWAETQVSSLKLDAKINALAFSPLRRVAALGLGTGKIVIWNWQEAKCEEVIQSFGHSIAHLVYTSDGTLVWGERSRSTATECGIYAWNGRNTQPYKIGTHRGAITALAPTGPRTVLSAGRDGQVALWEVEYSRQIGKIQLEPHNWVREIAVKPGGQLAALLHKKISLVNLPQLKEVYQPPLKPGGQPQKAAFSPDGQLLALAHPGRRVSLHRLDPRRGLVTERANLGVLTSSYQLHSLVTLPLTLTLQPILAVATKGGTLDFIHWQTGQSLGAAELSWGRLNLLKILPQANLMATVGAGASFTLWDLGVIELRQLFHKPLGQARPGHLAAIAKVRENSWWWPTSLKASVDFIELIIRHRFRYDVELAEISWMAEDKFDIEIEG